MRVTLGCVLVAAALAGFSLTPPVEASAEGSVTFPVLLYSAPSLDHAGPAVTTESILDQIEVANEIFMATGVRFELVGVREISRAHSRLESRLDRHRLLRYLHPRVINVFAVHSMRDVDHPEQWRRGVHWHHPSDTRQHFVVVTSIGPRTTLAHELGHFFGNHQHSDVGGNIMSYDHGAHPCFDSFQMERVVRHATRFLRSRQLRPLGEVTRRVARRRPSRSEPAAVVPAASRPLATESARPQAG